MACYHPLEAFQTASGDVVFAERGDIVRTLRLPCGRCIGCRVERSREWAVRVIHECKMSEHNCFLTLTYDDEHIPYRNSLNYTDFQRFMRRLRKLPVGKGVRFFACGEYGGLTQRPHFHAGLFGVDFHEDRKLWCTRRGFPVYHSETVTRLWPYGFHEIGSLTAESGGYIARYSLKKVTGDLAADHYRRYDADTGEVYYLEPEMLHMSLKPGIGARWFDRFGSDVYPHDRVVVGGVVQKPPRYYDKRAGDSMMSELKAQRELRGAAKAEDNTPERLAVKEVVETAKFNFYKRS